MLRTRKKKTVWNVIWLKSIFHFVPNYKLDTFCDQSMWPKQHLSPFQVWGDDLIIFVYYWKSMSPWHFQQTKAEPPTTTTTPTPAAQTLLPFVRALLCRGKLFPLLPMFGVCPAAFSLQTSDFWQDAMKTTSKTSVLMERIKEYSSGNLYQAGLSEKVYH